VTLKVNADQMTMELAIQAFGKKLHKNAVGLFYFSGHGAQHAGDNYLIPINSIRKMSATEHLKYKAVNAGYVLGVMQDADNGLNIVILDACRDNPFKSFSKSLGRGLTRMASAEGTLIAYATAPGTVAWGGEAGERNSPYTKHLLRFMKQPNLPIESVLKKVRKAVIQETRKTATVQKPWYEASISDEFYFSSMVVPPDSFPPGKVFHDSLQVGGYAPEMVVIKAGRFQMGDIRNDGDSDEKPVHWVNIEKFAMGKYEVTNAEFVRFLNAVKRRGTKKEPWFETKGEDSDSHIMGSIGNFYIESNYENHPVIEISWYGAIAYTEWLTQQTGKHYRLPSESEWEYAARAGTKTKYWWGNDIGKNKANCYKDLCNDNFDYTAPVGSFRANPFDLYDTVGNVWEWCADNWHGDYKGAPSDGRVWKGGNKNRRVLRGGSWSSNPTNARAANRSWNDRYDRFINVGFRVAARAF
jgi:formylglycine-generating enzyme required for sulfatase activity